MTSKFRGIFEGAKERDPEPADVEARPEPSAAAPSTTPPPAEAHSPAPRRPGRPPGKRSDPGFVQVTAYVPADLHHEIKLALLQERQGREFSELVAELLSGWLNARRSG